MKNTFLVSLVSVLLFLVSGASVSRAADALVNVKDLLTASDLQDYYGVPLKLASNRERGEAPNPHVTTLGYISADTKAQATIVFSQTESAEAAHTAADRTRNSKAFPGIKIEDAAGLGDYAFWFGKQLIVTKGPYWFVLTATAKKAPGSEAEAREATTAVAKKILEHLAK